MMNSEEANASYNLSHGAETVADKLRKLKASSAEHQKVLEDVTATIKSCRETQETIAKTQERVKSEKDEYGNAISSVHALEAKWQAFQDAFDTMNKQLIQNIATSLGKTVHLSTKKVEHKKISIEKSCKLIADKKCKNIVVLTGAGISVESGIPTYRDNDGFWTIGSENYTPQEIATREFFDRDPKAQWCYNLQRKNEMANAKPNEGHHKLKELEDYCKTYGKTFQLITQNIDGLHGDVGHENEIYCIHGDMNYARCPNISFNGCKLANKKVAFPKISMKKVKEKEFQVPKCNCCGSILRPHVLWFDESYSENLYRLTSTINAVKNADLLIVIGTCYQTSLPQRILGYCNTNNTPVIDVNPNLNADVLICPLLMVQKTATEFLCKILNQLNVSKYTKKHKKYTLLKGNKK